MTEPTIGVRVLDGGLSPGSALIYEAGSIISPDSAVRQLHIALPKYGIRSPFTAATERLGRVDRMAFQAGQLDIAAGIRRRQLVERLASGETDLAAALDSLGPADIAIAGPEAAGPAAKLATEAVQAAKSACAGELAAASGHVFDELAKAAAEAVATLEGLPEPPHQLWTHGDPSVLLAQAPGHEQTLSIVASATAKFWELHRLSGLVRNPAGHGYERFPDGAPRLAATYKNWRLTLGDADQNLRQTRQSMRLWRTVCDNWQPGIWRPQDVETQPSDRGFGAKLRQLGEAVTGG